MPRVCILTDSTVHFTSPNFLGHDLVSVLPMRISLDQMTYSDGQGINPGKLPDSARNDHNLDVLPPSEDAFIAALDSISRECSHVLVILHSAQLSPTIASAHQIVAAHHVPAEVHIIDSQTIGVGLGMVIQAAAHAIISGASISEIKPMLHRLIPRVYTIYCTQSLTYLIHSGQLDPAQAVVGEMLGLAPFFTLENGHLVPIQKAKSSRNMLDIFEEFISEFSGLEHIAVFQGTPLFNGEMRNLRERIREQYHHTSYSEHTLTAVTGALLGPRSMGIVTLVS